MPCCEALSRFIVFRQLFPSRRFPLYFPRYFLPKLLASKFGSSLRQPDANGIVLAGVELGNKINWAAFNPEFPLPSEGKILSRQVLGKTVGVAQLMQGRSQGTSIFSAIAGRLQFEHLCVPAAGPDECIVRTLFDNRSTLKDDNSVRHSNCRETVRNQKGHLALGEFAESLEHFVLGFRIQRGCRFI